MGTEGLLPNWALLSHTVHTARSAKFHLITPRFTHYEDWNCNVCRNAGKNINSSTRADPESDITYTHISSSQLWLQGLFTYLLIYTSPVFLSHCAPLLVLSLCHSYFFTLIFSFTSPFFQPSCSSPRFKAGTVTRGTSFVTSHIRQIKIFLSISYLQKLQLYASKYELTAVCLFPVICFIAIIFVAFYSIIQSYSCICCKNLPGTSI